MRRDLGIVRDKLELHRKAAANSEGVDMLLTDSFYPWNAAGNALLNRHDQQRIVELMEVEANRLAEALAVKQTELDTFTKESGITEKVAVG